MRRWSAVCDLCRMAEGVNTLITRNTDRIGDSKEILVIHFSI